jgi:acyl-CoA hydrolase
LADTVVTEHGVAEIKNLSTDARAEALIQIAAPEHQQALVEAWAEMREQL